MVYLLLCVSSVSEQMSLFVCVCLINSRPLKGISLFKRESEKCFSLTYVLALPRRGLLSEDLYKQLTAAFFMSLKYPPQRTHTHMHYLLVLWPFSFPKPSWCRLGRPSSVFLSLSFLWSSVQPSFLITAVMERAAGGCFHLVFCRFFQSPISALQVEERRKKVK